MNNSYNWYSTLIKPSWAPPSWLFGPVWTALYTVIAVSFGTVFYKVYTKEIPFAVAVPFLLNLLFNFIFTPLQFGLKNNLYAAVDVVLVWLTIVWFMYSVWTLAPQIKWVVYANIPYLIWVSFASVLQITITVLNK
jgi:tryptophan-rich sensory protein